MTDQIESISVSIIKYLDDILNNIKISTDLFNVNRPSDIIEKIDDIESHMKQVESIMTFIPSLAQGLKTSYIEAFNHLTEVRNVLIESVNQRRNSDIQPNTMVTLYNEDNLLKDITICKDNDFEPSVDNLCSDSIIDVKEYSNLSIISRMEGEGNLFGRLLMLIQMSTTKLEELSVNYKANILEIRTMIKDGEVIAALSNDCDETFKKLKSLVQTNAYLLQRQRADIIKLFQVYLDIKNNYELYHQAVDSYTSLALESVFGTPFILC